MLRAASEKSASAVPLQGPFVVVADSPATDVVEALRSAGAFPVIETNWADAATALASVEPEAVVLAEPCSDAERADEYARALSDKLDAGSGAFTPVIARLREDAAAPIMDALTIAASAPAARIVQRLSAALRIRALHGTVLRRMETLVSRGEAMPDLPDSDPLEEATVLVAGRGRSYPQLAVAVGERVGLVGALSVESAARALNARDIDGMVIGEGFGPRIVEALLTVLAEDTRFRELPVAVLGGHQTSWRILRTPAQSRPHCRRTGASRRAFSSVRAAACLRATAQAHAQIARRQGHDPSDTGLLGQEAFWRDLNRAVDDAEKRGVGLSIARFSFDHNDRRTSLDAARLIARLMRQVDFACREADDSIFAVFTETDLRAAHVIARRSQPCWSTRCWRPTARAAASTPP